jgi:hypothetical protein
MVMIPDRKAALKGVLSWKFPMIELEFSVVLAQYKALYLLTISFVSYSGYLLSESLYGAPKAINKAPEEIVQSCFPRSK